MGRIAERTEIGVVRGLDPHPATGSYQAVKLLHRPDYIGHMLNHMNSPEVVERTVRERVRKAVEVANHIGGRCNVPVDPNGPGVFPNTTADVECFQPYSLTRTGSHGL